MFTQLRSINIQKMNNYENETFENSKFVRKVIAMKEIIKFAITFLEEVNSTIS